jgi:hypothetical protein
MTPQYKRQNSVQQAQMWFIGRCFFKNKIKEDPSV